MFGSGETHWRYERSIWEPALIIGPFLHSDGPVEDLHEVQVDGPPANSARYMWRSEDVAVSGGADGDVADRDAPGLIDVGHDLVDDVLRVENGIAD